MARVRLDWRGPQVLEAVLDAAREAIDETLTEAAADTAQVAPRRTGRLQGEVEVEPARLERNKVSGRFGVAFPGPAFYGLFQEYRNPFIRPVGDRVFPAVVDRLTRRVKASVR